MAKKSSFNNQFEIQKYLFHKQTFNIKDHLYLAEFEALLKASEDFSLERSCKLAGDKIFPARFILFYLGQDQTTSLGLIFKFFDAISHCPKVSLNRSLLNKLFDNKFELDKLYQVIAGIDYRENLRDSRVKVFFKIGDYSEKISQALMLHGCNEMILDLMPHDRLLFGIDLFFSGETKIKIYLNFDHYDLTSAVVLNKLKKHFSEKIIGLINKCQALHITFKGKSFQRIIDFYPKNREAFIKEFNNRRLIDIDQKMKSTRYGKTGLISLSENEINKGIIKNANLYIE